MGRRIHFFVQFSSRLEEGRKYCQPLPHKIHLNIAYENSNTLKWGASSRWSSSLYGSMRNSGQMTIGKMHTTLLSKGSPDPSDFLFEINVGKRRIRHKTTLNLNFQSVLSRSRNLSFNFRIVACRIRLLPTIISKTKWLGSELPLRAVHKSLKWDASFRWSFLPNSVWASIETRTIGKTQPTLKNVLGGWAYRSSCQVF